MYTYGSKKPLFDCLDLTIQEGSIYGLLGKNGAGKSTLIKIMSGLLFPNSGIVSVIGHQPGKRNPTFLNQIFLLTEEFDLPKMSIRQYELLYSSFYPHFDPELFARYLVEFGLEAKDHLTSLSYGQKKKFLLSFALATNCKLVILDEPTNGLDIPSKSQFRKVVAGAMSDERTFIISTHQVRDMEGLIDPVILLDDGEIVFNESLQTVTSKLKVVKGMKEPKEEGLIYSENHFGSYVSVYKNNNASETNISLELLFNTVIHHKEQIHELFRV